ncbi:hypothetical protein ASD00_31260 [Ensifer sp. Root31]|uniref:ABC transporter permease n=1 Tax=Ensifer sp. Root31 TaxID=1736512 RepID=UPI00070CE953|nr:ABC transporter permease [Ensifer sp. Root31]KQU86371.1 hypothetical protein ASD00_31260 [Ensifer sp. Root31]
MSQVIATARPAAPALWRPGRGLTTVLLLAALSCSYALLAPRFLGMGNVSNILRNASLIAIVATGQMFVIAVGGLDLSIAAVIALSSVVAAMAMVELMPIFVGHEAVVVLVGGAVSLGVGALVGLFNALLITRLKLVPLVATLATWTLLAAFASWLTQGTPIYGLPTLLTHDIARSRPLGLPLQVHIYAACLVVTIFFWYLTPFGRHLRSIGSSPLSAKAAGVRTDLTELSAYTICSMLAGLCGFLLTAQVGSGDPSLGQSFLMDSIAGAILGGTVLKGGRARPELIFLGALLLVIVTNGLNLVGMDSRLLTVAVGFILFGAAYLSGRTDRDLA